MTELYRRLCGIAAVVACCAIGIGPASAQWGYPAYAPYGSAYSAPAYGGSAYYPAYQAAPNVYPSYATGIYNAYPSGSYRSLRSPYGYRYPYGRGIWGNRRGRVDWDDWTPFGDREIEYEYKRNGTIEIDIDD